MKVKKPSLEEGSRKHQERMGQLSKPPRVPLWLQLVIVLGGLFLLWLCWTLTMMPEIWLGL